jgi:hypothetical protein
MLGVARQTRGLLGSIGLMTPAIGEFVLHMLRLRWNHAS